MCPSLVSTVGRLEVWSTTSCLTVRFIQAPIPSQTPLPWPGAPNSHTNLNECCPPHDAKRSGSFVRKCIVLLHLKWDGALSE